MAFGFEDAGDEAGAVDEVWVVEDAEDGLAAALGVGEPVDDHGDAREDDRARAHGTGFLCREENGALKSPVAEGGGRLRDGLHFRMGRGVAEGLGLVVGAAKEPRLTTGNTFPRTPLSGGCKEFREQVGRGGEDDATGGNLALRRGLFGFGIGEAHAVEVEGVEGQGRGLGNGRLREEEGRLRGLRGL